MTQQANKKTPEQMVEAVFALDLDPIKFKLMDKKEGHGWTREEADRHELEYKRFLALVAKYPDAVITPDTNVDKFWHGHILDTMKYAEDCQNVFGYFLHHFPYFGMRDEEDAANLAEASTNTRRLYQQEFGSATAGDATYCARATDSAYCARVAGEAESAYCARVAGEAESSYCARVAGQTDSSYCARVAGAETAEPSASYCARVAAETDKQAAYCAAQSASYCARVAGAPESQEASAAYCAAQTASYCARVADETDKQASYCAASTSSYCARVAGEKQAYCAANSAGYQATVLGKGRPGLEPAKA
ncbi:MAG TPA: hypothetical protein VEC35_03700 [Noviherbaspirillum sp.]|nr:hypothetical protein [Noviherbaspirillum sp.]